MKYDKSHADRLKEITDNIESGIKDLFQSERYAEYLRAMSRFHRYSLNNTILIVLQRPDASLVAGFNKWRDEFKRNVKKGEKGIKILAPAPFKKTVNMQRIDPITNRAMVNDSGQPITEDVEITIPRFKVVTVFDVSQTEGKELPSIGVNTLMGDVKNHEAFMAALVKASPFPLVYEDIQSSAKGYCHFAERRIAINTGMSDLQTIKTAIHEIAHAKLHNVDLNNKDEMAARADKFTREVQAESVAYTVCQYYGLDTSDYSFAYIAGWSSEKEMPELRASLDVIREAAHDLIESIDNCLSENEKGKDRPRAEETKIKSFMQKTRAPKQSAEMER